MRLLRIGKRIALIFVTLLVVVTGAYYYAVTPHRPHVPVGSAEDLLFRADTLAWNDRWEEAAPLYQQAEALLPGAGESIESLVRRRQPDSAQSIRRYTGHHLVPHD